ncbi:hypothetical protein CKM354_000862900 [Cercospora kikuchii]|uniref:Rhodopsin domain-containing protein n=1 Tax=Cercospora kikuchii TaxID=84275 RepID=A0A9P3FJJ0_9PEZI|nr:uncharacterized protein CKM354_000862900 [Cercospora kikuchii]GIZ45464.1 hypothetical protein CKM354_000862900 [Cercospora kikuchii]
MAGGFDSSGDSAHSQWSPGTRYFVRITDNDHSGWLWIITVMSLIYVLVAFVVRFILTIARYGYDDWALLASTVLALGQYIAVLFGLGHGLGKSTSLLSTTQIDKIEISNSAHVFLFFLAHTMSKISTALLTLKLFETGRARSLLLSRSLVFFSATYGVGSILAVAVNCQNPSTPEPDSGSCPNLLLRWQISLGLDVATETLLVIVPMILLVRILNKRSSRITVAAIFACRLVDIVFAGLNFYQITLLRHTSDYGTGIIPPIIWMQAELLWSIISASLPCLKAFMRPFDKVGEDTWRSGQGYSASRSGGSLGPKRASKQGGAMVQDEIMLERYMPNRPSYNNQIPPQPEKDHDLVKSGHYSSTTCALEEDRRSWGSQDQIIQLSKQWTPQHNGTWRNVHELA